METNWAAEHLQTIRTLMERSALYRRALAPIMITIGTLGIAAALAGWYLQLLHDYGFVGYWLCVGSVGIVLSFFLVRRQALRDSEPFWTPPVRRIVAAVMPSWFCALFFSSLCFLGRNDDLAPVLMPILWTILYGISLHAAGFFMPRGIRLLGWIFIAAGILLPILLLLLRWDKLGLPSSLSDVMLCSGHFMMGLTFGGLHLAYGIYLYFTENRKNAA